jgi:DNA repair exonuclease SbcCD nuclease subunit
MKDCVKDLVNAGIEIRYLLGNHDSNRDPVSMVFDPLVKFVDRSNYLDPEAARIDLDHGFDIILVPYLLEGDEIPNFTGYDGGWRLALLHNTVENVVFQTGQKAGDFAGRSHERILLESDLKTIGGTHFVSGHIHRAQTVKFKDFDVEYTGTPSILNFGETKSGNTFLIVEFDDEYPEGIFFTRIPVPNRKWLIERGLPEHIEKDTVYKLILTNQEARTFRQVEGLFREAGSVVFIENADKQSRRVKRRRSQDQIADLSEQDRLRLWCKEQKLSEAQVKAVLQYDERVRNDHKHTS